MAKSPGFEFAAGESCAADRLDKYGKVVTEQTEIDLCFCAIYLFKKQANEPRRQNNSRQL
ncbi:protein of unknown function [Citrobacter amalonaticus]|uniref:Uncharacterized protein n=1 Tax=Citrobacter amalonaticus TaxID=35703 RepID=A0AAX2BDX5_CITAM|nr:protein of unknown function [Citrobacter amalonaticus]SAZ06352.1 protein of unknown function [Citrobacter amalonaticus]